MKYHHLRLSVLPLDRPPLLEAAATLPPISPRQQYLRRVFGQRIDFLHRQKTFIYLHLGIHESDGRSLYVGRIGRLVDAVENAPPEEGFKEVTRSSWRASNVVIDTSDQPDGQIIAFQHHYNIGRPLPIATSLIDHVNRHNQDSGWFIDINPITDKHSFWEAVRQHKGEITAAEFHFATPNILGITSNLNRELKEKRERHNATTVTETLRNPSGTLDLAGQDVEDSVEYISKGGGNAKLRSGRKVLYNSKRAEKLTEVKDDEPLTEENTSTWKKIADILFG